MIILSPQGACFVAVPKTGSMSMSKFLEDAVRQGEPAQYDVEGLHEWHASIREVEETGRVPFSLYDIWSFAIARNPFDRLVSYCASLCPDFQIDPAGAIKAELRRALEEGPNRWMLPQSFFLSEVRTVYRFEALPEAVVDIRKRLGIDARFGFPTLNDSERGPRYAPYFDQSSKSMVEELYAEDLSTYTYRF